MPFSSPNASGNSNIFSHLLNVNACCSNPLQNANNSLSIALQKTNNQFFQSFVKSKNGYNGYKWGGTGVQVIVYLEEWKGVCICKWVFSRMKRCMYLAEWKGV